MATLKEQTTVGFQRVAQEINKVRQEMKEISSSGGGTAADTSYGNYGYDNVSDALDSLLYKAISITGFSHNVGTQEMGSTVTAAKLTWAFNKTPTTLTLDGEEIDVESTSVELTDLAITTSKTWTLKATDEKGAEATKTATVSFLNGVYSGVGSVDADGVDSAFVQTLTKALASSRAKTFSANAGDGQYIYYAYPARFGNATFYVGGFEGGFDLLTTFDYTNASGYTESYNVYRSANANLGATDVTVK